MNAGRMFTLVVESRIRNFIVLEKMGSWLGQKRGDISLCTEVGESLEFCTPEG